MPVLPVLQVGKEAMDLREAMRSLKENASQIAVKVGLADPRNPHSHHETMLEAFSVTFMFFSCTPDCKCHDDTCRCCPQAQKEAEAAAAARAAAQAEMDALNAALKQERDTVSTRVKCGCLFGWLISS